MSPLIPVLIIAHIKNGGAMIKACGGPWRCVAPCWASPMGACVIYTLREGLLHERSEGLYLGKQQQYGGYFFFPRHKKVNKEILFLVFFSSCGTSFSPRGSWFIFVCSDIPLNDIHLPEGLFHNPVYLCSPLSTPSFSHSWLYFVPCYLSLCAHPTTVILTVCSSA